jgi:hypothetical protein
MDWRRQAVLGIHQAIDAVRNHKIPPASRESVWEIIRLTGFWPRIFSSEKNKGLGQ